ncbi:MAG: 4Fe-4S binding protein [Betaproteobacteria bacterium]
MPGNTEMGPAVEARLAEVPVEINQKWCKGCDICVAFCPKEVLTRPEGGKAQVAHPEKCTRCRLCEIMCPDLAIVVMPASRKGASSRGQGGDADA